jgi:hypothetical protein
MSSSNFKSVFTIPIEADTKADVGIVVGAGEVVVASKLPPVDATTSKCTLELTNFLFTKKRDLLIVLGISSNLFP